MWEPSTVIMREEGVEAEAMRPADQHFFRGAGADGIMDAAEKKERKEKGEIK
jgi:hypothetical protein